MLLKLLLVDDETSTRAGLLERIDWHALGIDEVTGARDGLEGLAIARTMQPDILISDIRMPGMSGIELAREIRVLLPQCRIIFLSGYSDKEYLKAAIRFGVLSYVEKPIDLDEIQDVIRQAVKVCIGAQQQKDRLQDDEELIQSVLLEEPEALTQLERRLHGAGGSACYTVLVLKSNCGRTQSAHVITAMRQSLRRYPRICGMCDDKYVCIVSGFRPESLRRDVASFFSDVTRLLKGEHILFCAVGTCTDRIGDIRASFDAASIALKRLFFRGYGSIVFFEEIAPPPMDLTEYDEAAFLRLVQEVNLKGINDFILSLCAVTKISLGAREGEIKDLFLKYAFDLMREAERRGIHLKQGDAEGEKFFWNALSDAGTMESLCDLFLKHVEKTLQAFKGLEANNRSIAQVIKEIHEHFNDPGLSIKQLAERVYLTPTYLSYLFKKVTGQTTSEYIMWYRIEKAKEMLISDNDKLTEVAQSVGYGDANYFTKAFKRQTGMTPSKYRESRGS